MPKTNTNKTISLVSRMRTLVAHPLALVVLVLGIIVATCIFSQRYLWHAWLPLQGYRNDELGFELQIPTGWKAQEAIEYQQVAFAPDQSAPGKGKLHPGIAIARNQTTDSQSLPTSEQYFTQLEKTLQQSFSNPQESDDTTLERYREQDRTRKRIGRHQALIVRVAIDNLGHQTDIDGEGVIAYIYVSRQRQYVLAATAPTTENAFLAQQQRIIATFRTLE